MWLLLLDVVQLGHVEGVGVFETPLDASAAATIQTPKLSFPQQVQECSIYKRSIRKCSICKRSMLRVLHDSDILYTTAHVHRKNCTKH